MVNDDDDDDDGGAGGGRYLLPFHPSQPTIFQAPEPAEPKEPAAQGWPRLRKKWMAPGGSWSMNRWLVWPSRAQLD